MAEVRPRRAFLRPWPLGAAGGVLLAWWLLWWGVSLRQPVPHLVCEAPGIGRFTTLPGWPLLGIDFQHNYAGAHAWLDGGDPYAAIADDPMNARYIYPPVTLAAFAWVRAFPREEALPVQFLQPTGPVTYRHPPGAVRAWMVAIVVLLAAGAVWSWRTRSTLGLSPLPLALVLGATLLSYPAMFELERGNCNVLPLLALLVAAAALRSGRGWGADLAAASAIALAAGIKAYPGLALLALVALRRHRAAALTVGFLLVGGAVLHGPLLAWAGVVRGLTAATVAGYTPFSHALGASWHLLWPDLGVPALGALPGTPAAATLVLLLIGAAGWHVYRAERRTDVAWPFLLWVVALGTFVSGISHDYNLIFVPLALLALWDARDPWWAQAIAGANLLWLQPLALGLGGAPLLLLKFTGTAAVGLLIRRRLAG